MGRKIVTLATVPHERGRGGRNLEKRRGGDFGGGTVRDNKFGWGSMQGVRGDEERGGNQKNENIK